MEDFFTFELAFSSYYVPVPHESIASPHCRKSLRVSTFFQKCINKYISQETNETFQYLIFAAKILFLNKGK